MKKINCMIFNMKDNKDMKDSKENNSKVKLYLIKKNMKNY